MPVTVVLLPVQPHPLESPAKNVMLRSVGYMVVSGHANAGAVQVVTAGDVRLVSRVDSEPRKAVKSKWNDILYCTVGQ